MGELAGELVSRVSQSLSAGRLSKVPPNSGREFDNLPYIGCNNPLLSYSPNSCKKLIQGTT